MSETLRQPLGERASPSGSISAADARWLFLFGVFAAALRLPALNRAELWVDEAATWWFGKVATEGGLFETLALEPTPPLFYLLTGLLARLFGDSELVLRLPSVVFGVLSLWPLYLLVRELFDRRVALYASAILAIHPLHVFYSREARVYPLLTLLVPLALYLAIRAARDGSRRHSVALFVTLVVLCYSHMYSLFLVPLTVAVGALFLPAWRSPRGWLPLMAPVAAAVALWFPYLVYTVPKLDGSGAAWSVALFFDEHPEEKNLLRSLAQLLLGANYHSDLRVLSARRVVSWLWLPGLLVQLTLIGAGVRRAWLRGCTVVCSQQLWHGLSSSCHRGR